MKRRKFLLTSVTALLGSTALNSVSQQPAVALNFDLVGVENFQPSNVDTILVDFQNFELKPKYVDETASDATVTITLDIDGHNKVQNQASVSLTNGETVNSSDLGSVVPIVQDSINSSKTALDGSITIDISHPDVSDSYKQSFTITDDTLLNGLVGYWPLHEWNGRANDLSGEGNHGTVNGATQGVWGRGALTAYSFDRNDDFINVGGPHVTDNTAFSFSVWVKTDDSSFSSSTSQQVIADCNDSNFDYGWTLKYVYGGDETENIAFELNDTTGSATGVGYDVVLDGWNHIVGVYDGSKIKLYLNSNFIGDRNLSDWQRGTSPVHIGKEQQSNSRYWAGSISEARLYDRDLSFEEIQQIYNLGSGDYTKRSLHDGSDSGAVSRYKFESGNVTRDLWGSNTLTDNTGSSGTSSDGVDGSSKVFDGSDDYLTASTSVEFKDITISAWIKADSLNTSGSDANSVVLINDDHTRALDVYSDSTSSTGQIRCNWVNGVASSRETNVTGWVHVALTYNYDTTESKIYINGQLENVESGNKSTVSASRIDIGKIASTGSSDYWDGLIDDVRIYDRELNLAEVQQLYQWGTRGQDLRDRTTTKNKNDLVGWWKLNETNGSTAYDSSGNGNNGNITGAGPAGTGTVSGPLGQTAYDFDGGSDKIDTGTEVQVETETTWTVSHWFKIDSDATNSVMRGSVSYDGATGGWYTRVDSDGQILYSNNDGGNGTNVSSTEPVIDDNWHHLVGVFDGNRTEQILYIDGQEVARNTSANSQMTDSDRTHYIGSYTDGSGGSQWFSGALSDVRIYNRPLTPQEVSYLYEQKF